MNEEHIGPLPDPTVSDVAGTHVEERVRRTTEEVRRFGSG